MCAFTANGYKLKPYLIFAYERIPKTFRDTFPHDKAVLQNSSNGWMDTERCVKFLEHVSCEMKSQGNNLPEEKIILFWDGHASHMSLQVCEKAKELGIVLVALYPNATFLIQPCDVAVFRSLKSHWRETVRALKFNDLNKVITKAEFPHLFLRAFDTVSSSTIQNGFKACGIFPWNKEAVHYEKCLGERIHPIEPLIIVHDEKDQLQNDDLPEPSRSEVQAR